MHWGVSQGNDGTNWSRIDKSFYPALTNEFENTSLQTEFSYLEDDDLDLFDEDDKQNIEEIKKRREKLLKDPEFRKKLEENRKRKAKEAIDLLNKINK